MKSLPFQKLSLSFSTPGSYHRIRALALLFLLIPTWHVLLFFFFFLPHLLYGQVGGEVRGLNTSEEICI